MFVYSIMPPRPPCSTLFPYTTLFRSVGSLDEDRPTVDGHGEGGAVLVGFGVDGDRAKADPSFVGVELLIAVDEGDGEVVQGLVAVSDRLTPMRIGDPVSG